MKARRFPKWSGVSIRIKLMLIVFLQIVLLISVCSAVLITENRRLMRYYEANGLQSAAVLHQTATHHLEALQAVTTFPIQQENIYSSSLFSLLSQECDTMNNHEFQNSLRIQGRQLFDLYDFLDTIIVYNVRGEGNYLERSRVYDAVCTLSTPQSHWAEQALAARGGAVVFSAEEGTGFGITSKEGRLIGVARSIINTDRMRSVGLIVAGFSPSQFEMAFDSIRQFHEQEYGIGYRGRFIAGSLQNDASASSLIAPSQAQDSQTLYAPSGSERYMYSVYHRDDNITVIIRTPLSVIHALQRPSATFYIVLFLVLAASLYIVHSCTNGILRPIQTLITACNQLEQLDTSVHVDGEAPAEIAQLYSTFNHMSQRIHTLVHEVLMQELTHNKLELQMLRAQISPHYLYNTLESIRMNAYMHGNLEVAEMSEMLAHNLQYILRGTNQEVLVREELQSVREYVRLLTLHYNDQICLHTDIEKDVLNCLTIKLILQPLVENAILHGLRNAHTPLTIDIHGYASDESLFFAVSDDGKGIPASRLGSLLHSLHSNSEQSEGSIGIKNLYRRLILYYGENCGVDIRSIEGEGTIVIVHFPIRRGKELKSCGPFSSQTTT